MLDIVLSSQKELVDNVVIQESLGSSDHNQLHFNIHVKSDKAKVTQCRRDFRKQNMYRVYKHTRKDTDYDPYKEALNAATNEVRKSERNFEHILAQHIK